MYKIKLIISSNNKNIVYLVNYSHRQSTTSIVREKYISKLKIKTIEIQNVILSPIIVMNKVNFIFDLGIERIGY